MSADRKFRSRGCPVKFFDQGNLLPGITGNPEEEIGAFYENYDKMKKAPDLFPRYPIA
jgi:hypothetical protein